MDPIQIEAFCQSLLAPLKSMQKQLEDFSNQIEDHNNWSRSWNLEDFSNQIEDHNNWSRSWNERGQRKSGLEIPTMGMVRCLSEKPNESPVDSQKELSCVPKQPKESPVDSQESLEEESFRPSDDPLMVNFSDIPNPPCDLVNRPTSVVPLEVPCPKPRKPLDIFLVSKSMSMSARVPMATNTVAQQGQPTQPTPLALILLNNLPFSQYLP